MITKDSLKDDFCNLGIKEGDTLFLRISYKAVGKIEGGPMVFLEALHEVIGEEGTIILTAFPKKYIRQLRFFHKKEVYSYENPPKPTTGVMPVMAMSYPGARMSKKMECSFVVLGKHSKYLTEQHTHDKSDYWLLETATRELNSKCLRIGGKKFTGTTHIAFSRALEKTNNYQRVPYKGLYLKENNKIEWNDSIHSVFCPDAFFSMCDKYLWPNIKFNKGKVGEGEAILTDMNETLAAEEEYISNNVSIMLCDNKDCYICRTTYSFSDSNLFKYLVYQVKSLLLSRKDKKTIIRKIKIAVAYKIFGSKTV